MAQDRGNWIVPGEVARVCQNDEFSLIRFYGRSAQFYKEGVLGGPYELLCLKDDDVVRFSTFEEVANYLKKHLGYKVVLRKPGLLERLICG